MGGVRTMVDSGEHVLIGPRVAAALGLYALVGVGLAMMAVAFPHLNLLFGFGFIISFAGAVGAAWVGYAEIRKLTLTGWLIAALSAIGFLAPLGVLHYAVSEGGEDVRVSFRFEVVGPEKIRVTYLFRNLGTEAALINGVGLYEFVTVHGLAEASNSTEICDGATSMNVVTAQLGQGFMGPGVQVGSNERRFSVYAPTALTIDGAPWDGVAPASIEGGKTKLITAEFVLYPEHRKNYNTLVLCPMVGMIDINNNRGIAICRGISETSNGNGRVESTSLQQFRVLPHSKAPTCPARRGVFEATLSTFLAFINPPAAAPPSPVPSVPPTEASPLWFPY
jgi:hypothetical protein